jgi:hypothetical protein
VEERKGGVREMQELEGAFIGEEGRGGARPRRWVAAGAINGGGARWRAVVGRFRGRGRGEAARVGLRRTYCHSVGIGEGAGKAGGRAAGGQVRKGRRREVGDEADGWAPSVGERERGGREGQALAGHVGRKRSWAAGLGWVVRFVLFFFLFFSFFQSFFKPIFSTLLNSNLLHNFLQLFPTILKTFQKLFLNNFSNIFKFKLSTFFLIQAFTPIFTIIFTIILRTFHKYFLRLLKPHHNQNSCIST